MRNIIRFMVPLMVLASIASMALAQAAETPGHRLVQERSEVAEYSRLLGDPEPWRRIRAAQSLAAMLGHAREPEAIRALLERALSDARVAEHVGPLLALDGGLEAVAHAQVAAAHRSDLERRELDEYADALGREAEVRLKTVVALSALLQTADQPEPVVRLLELSLFDRDQAVAAQATRALGRWERREREQDGELGHLESPDDRQHRRLDAERAEVAEYQSRLEHSELSVRLSAVAGLAALSRHAIDNGPVLGLLRQAAADPDPVVAAQAMRALERDRTE